MNNVYIKNTIRFILLLVVQVVILNKIKFGGYINPYIYILFVILLPFETPKWLLLISGFSLGLLIDVFSAPMGLHAAATTLICFLRPSLIKILIPDQDIDSTEQPGITYLGFRKFFFYSLALVFIHHLCYFYIEVFRFEELFQTMYRVILNTLFSLLIIILVLFIFQKKN